jgi:hypothetical protein
MTSQVRWIAAACLLAGLTGCCASPYRFYQNAYGFNDPLPDRYAAPGPPAPKQTPPGPVAPAYFPIGESTSSGR